MACCNLRKANNGEWIVEIGKLKVTLFSIFNFNLQIFLTCFFQQIFFFRCKRIKAMHVDLVKNLVNSLLRKIGSFYVRLSFTFLKKFFFCFFLWLIGVKKIIDPIKKTVHTNTPI